MLATLINRDDMVGLGDIPEEILLALTAM